MEKSERVFSIPEYEYFSMGGKYSGCKRGAAQDDFSFRITPGKEELKVQVWYDINCFELSELQAESAFGTDRGGYLSALDWIEEQYKLWLKDHKPRNSMYGYFTKEEDFDY